MIAEPGRRYAIIQDGRCHWKFDITTLPACHDGIQTVDITNLQPEPNEGDLFDGVAFMKPPASPAPPRPKDIVDIVRELPPERRAELRAELNRT